MNCALIDVDRVVRERAGSRARYIPRCVTAWLARFVHQDYVNTYLRQGRTGVDFCQGALEYLGVTVEVEGTENLPSDDEPCTFVSNHPLGAIDGVTLGAVLGAHYDGRIKILVNDLLMNLEGLAPLCIPVNKLGRNSRQLATLIDEAYASRNHIITFPAGLCSRQARRGGEIRDLTWTSSFVKKSVSAHRRVVPIHFVGENSPRFYRVARWCKRLGLKVNLAMLLLPDEMVRSRGSHYRVVIGKPLPPDTFDASHTAAEWAEWMQCQVYSMHN